MALRIGLVIAAILVVIVVSRLIARWQRPAHPPIDLGDFGPRPGVVVFTSTDCANCREALAIVRSLDVPYREVTWELEPGVFDGIGIEAVPLTTVVDDAGGVQLLAAGVPRKRSVKRAAVKVGLIES